jgi:hypothetical protein
MPPRAVTDRGIALYRQYDPKYLILHYVQPHYPFLTEPDLDDGIPIDEIGGSHDGPIENRTVWDRLRDGEVKREAVWEAYLDNLHAALDEVELLLQNVDADRVVVTSDHGNAMGEFGIYGHPSRTPIPPLVTVPWLTLTATDSGDYEPSVERVDSRDNPGVERRLQDLGYLG